MSNIPSSAIGAALSPIQRTAQELLRVRQVQGRKNTHHSEEVEELDDAGVSSVHDQQQGKAKKEKEQPHRNEGENVEIEALLEAGQGEGPAVVAASEESHLDISA